MKVTMKNFSQRGLLQLGIVMHRRKMSGQVNTHLALSPFDSAEGRRGRERHPVTHLGLFINYFFKRMM
jgi:hypothetical protein